MNATDQPCDCPAAWLVQRHPARGHEQDCGHTQPGMACGGCWACIAAQVAYHQVLASRGGAA